MLPFKVISFNHRFLPLETIGKLHIEESEQKRVLSDLKNSFNLDELMFISTCNRVEFYFITQEIITHDYIVRLIQHVNGNLPAAFVEELASCAFVQEGLEAVRHILKVASSLNSLVVGEREIITQLRKSYDFCNDLGLTGDFTRLLVKQTIETAKQIFTETDIAKNPISVVSLANRKLRDLGIKNDARILIIGAGDTNTKMANYLRKHKFANFSVFNRTYANAETLASVLNGKAYSLEALQSYKGGFDVMVVCTGSTTPIMNNELYSSLLNGDSSKKVLIDLSIPANISSEVVAGFSNFYIDINSLRNQAESNLKLRQSEIAKCEQIIEERINEFIELQKERNIELAFGEIPRQVRAIKDIAVSEVFAKEISELDPKSKEVLDKVLVYMEKKYNAVAMKTAKDVFLKSES